MAKKVLIFSFVYYPKLIGGAEIAVKEITDRISKSDIDFHMVTMSTWQNLPQTEQVGNVTVHRVGPWTMAQDQKIPGFRFHFYKYFFPFKAAKEAARLNKEISFDATWSIMANYAGFAGLFFKKKFPQIPFVLTLQEGDPIEHIKKRTRFVSGWFKEIFVYADRITAISKYLANFAKNMGAKSEPVIIPNGVDIALFSKQFSNEELRAARLAMGVDENKKILITTSRLSRKNGVDTAIEAMPHLPSNLVFVVIGQGEDEQKLKNLAHKNNVEDRVKFLGFVAHNELPVYLKASNIFIRVSRSEGMGNSFVEAMAANIPVVGTAMGGIPDFLHDRETGFVCEPNNPKSVANAVNQILSLNTDDMNKILLAASTLVKEKYDWNRIASEMKQIL